MRGGRRVAVAGRAGGSLRSTRARRSDLGRAGNCAPGCCARALLQRALFAPRSRQARRPAGLRSLRRTHPQSVSRRATPVVVRVADGGATVGPPAEGIRLEFTAGGGHPRRPRRPADSGVDVVLASRFGHKGVGRSSALPAGAPAGRPWTAGFRTATYSDVRVLTRIASARWHRARAPSSGAAPWCSRPPEIPVLRSAQDRGPSTRPVPLPPSCA